MVIKRNKVYRRQCQCGKTFTTTNIEQYQCLQCRLKGKTYRIPHITRLKINK